MFCCHVSFRGANLSFVVNGKLAALCFQAPQNSPINSQNHRLWQCQEHLWDTEMKDLPKKRVVGCWFVVVGCWLSGLSWGCIVQGELFFSQKNHSKIQSERCLNFCRCFLELSKCHLIFLSEQKNMNSSLEVFLA